MQSYACEASRGLHTEEGFASYLPNSDEHECVQFRSYNLVLISHLHLYRPLEPVAV